MAQKYYPLKADYDAVAAWLRAQGLSVADEDPLHLSVFASGTVAQVSRALGLGMARVSANGRQYSSADSPPLLPAALAGAVLGVNGLQPHVTPKARQSGVTPAVAKQPPYYPSEMLHAYGGDALGLDGTGQEIGIVIDRFPNEADLLNFWTITGVPQQWSNISFVQVISGTIPAPNSQAAEETLDTEWSSGIASGARVRVYATKTLSFVNIDRAYQRIISDLPARTGLRQVSLSFGAPETQVAASQLQTDAQYFAAMANAGVTVFVSTGDNGSEPGSVLQVETPSSDPSVIAVGGTSLALNTDGSISTETAWSGTGGGVSQSSVRPAWQLGAGLPAGTKRTVPDVAAPADPNTGAKVIVNGQSWQYGGTSWSAPMWAGFCALINQARAQAGLGSIGSMGAKLYPLLGSSAFRDITKGSNGDYTAGANYDLCTGLGSPNLAALIPLLAQPAVTAKPNLTTFNPAGWSDNLVASRSVGVTADAPLFRTFDTIYVDYAVVNNGTTFVNTAWRATLYVDGVETASDSFNGQLAVNATITKLDRAIGPLAAGTHTIKLVLDTDNSVAETSETDNTYQKLITVSDVGLPNLTLTQPAGWATNIVAGVAPGATSDAATITSADTIFLNYDPWNNGLTAVSAVWQAAIYIDNVLARTDHFSTGLAAGMAYTPATDENLGSLAVGDHTIKIVLDPDNAVGEADETDNVFQKTITVTAPQLPNLAFYQPDGWSDGIVITDVKGTTIDAVRPLSTETLYLNFAPANYGEVPVIAAWNARVILDGVETFDFAIASGPPALTYFNDFVDLPVGPLAPGVHVVKVVLDTEDAVAESAKDDNSLQKAFTVFGPTLPNLTFAQPAGWTDAMVVSTTTAARSDSASYLSTDSIYVSFAALNDASVSVSGGWTGTVYVDEVAKTTHAFSPGLAPFGTDSGALDLPLGSLTPGTHVIKVVLDSGGTVDEADETDNTRTKTISVGLGTLPLASDTPLAGLSASLGEQKYYHLTVPAGTVSLSMTMNGGTGDADLYLKAGALPTTSLYDYRPYLDGNNEQISVSDPAPGDWYVMLDPRQAYTGVTLTASLSSHLNVVLTASPANGGTVSGGGALLPGTQVTAAAAAQSSFTFLDWTENGTEVSSSPAYVFAATASRNLVANFQATTSLTPGSTQTALSGSTGSQKLFQIMVPAGAASLSITASGGSGHVNLFARAGAVPTAQLFDAFSANGSSAASLIVTQPTAGPWYFLLIGGSDYAGVNLTATAPEATFTITAQAATAGGQVTGGGLFAYGTDAAITAQPAFGYRFAGWMEGSSLVSQDTTYHFTVTGQRNLLATFAPAAALASNVTGVYGGLIGSNQTTHETSGFIYLNLMPTSGFTGFVVMGAQRMSFLGYFDANTHAWSGLAQNGYTSLNLHLTLPPGTPGAITGSTDLQYEGAPVAIAMERAVVTNQAPQAGFYTLVLPSDPAQAGDPKYPHGHGGGFVGVSVYGGVYFVGRLGDGASASGFTALTADGRAPVYLPEYYGRGSVSGWLTFADVPDTSDFSGVLRWSKEPNARDPSYPAGFAGQIQALGSRYAGGQPILNFHAAGSAQVTFAEPDGTPGGSERITLDTANRVLVTAPDSSGLLMGFDPSDGLMGGYFFNPADGLYTPFLGIVLQKQQSAWGSFLTPSGVGGVSVKPATH